MQEIWKDLIYDNIPKENRFEISNLGNLRNKYTKKHYKQSISGKGYFSVVVSLGSASNKVMIKIHRAVGIAFLDNDKNCDMINHKDGNKLNNTLENLEWCNNKYNIIHAVNLGLIKGKKGTSSNCSKFSDSDILFIRNNYKSKDKEYGCRALSKRFNVSHSVISDIINNKTYI